MSAPVRFVIFTMPRSGSTWLVNLLRSHPQIQCHGELFQRDQIVTNDRLLRRPPFFRFRRAAPGLFLRFAYSRRLGARAVGLKMLNDQAPAQQAYLVQRRDVRKVLLRRGNILAAYSSLRVALETDQWIVPKGGNATKKTIRFDSKDYERYARKRSTYYDRRRAELESAGGPFIEVLYETLSQPGTHRAILDFLGVDPDIDLKSGVRRQNTPRIIDRFSNPDDVRRHMAEIGCTGWLSDVPSSTAG